MLGDGFSKNAPAAVVRANKKYFLHTLHL
jgi:hypothetical protein